MTREEAIEVLKDIYNYTRFDTYTTNEARTMAIKALENEPRFLVHSDGKIEQIIEPCDDCVSRQALLEFFKDDDYVVNEINNMPSVLPKRKQGEWTKVEDGLPETHKDSRLIYRGRSDEVMCKIKADEDLINSCGYLIEHADGHKEWQTDCYMSDDDEVIAWMPIPKYEGVE